jgi:exosortase
MPRTQTLPPPPEYQVVRRPSILGTWTTVVFGIGLAGTLLWAFWPTVTELTQLWAKDPKYSHGYLVPLFAVWLAWNRIRTAHEPVWSPSWWGLPLLAASLVMRWVGVYYFVPWLTSASIVPAAFGCIVLAGGGNLLRLAWPAAAFLGFMLPMPFRLESAVAQPLQQLATSASVYVLQTVGLPAYAEGNVLCLRQERVNVVEACNGLSMLMMFAALSVAVVLVSRRPLLDKAIILASAIPIALACNIARIAGSAVLYATVGHTVGDAVPASRDWWIPVEGSIATLDFHDLTGYFMMPLALVLLWMVIRVIDALFVPESPVASVYTRSASPRMRAALESRVSP